MSLRSLYNQNPSIRRVYRKSRELKRLLFTIPAILEVSKNTTYLCGRKELDRSSDDCVVVALVRNGEAYVKKFIEHYLSLGFKHIYFLDNGSTDATVPIARGYEEVSIYQCDLPYKHFQVSMKAYLVNRFSFNKWCLLVDIDEFFDFPNRDIITLKQLINYFDYRHDSAVMLQMLDMYPDSTVQALGNSEDENFLESHKYFEVNTITKSVLPPECDYQADNPDIRFYHGGVRSRLFKANPCLSKFSLIKPGWFSYQAGAHLRSSAKIADISCVLFHYKFLNSFTSTVANAVRERQYYQGSQEYLKYQETLQKNENLAFVGEPSLEFKNLQQLVDLNFIQVSKSFELYCRSIQG